MDTHGICQISSHQILWVSYQNLMKTHGICQISSHQILWEPYHNLMVTMWFVRAAFLLFFCLMSSLLMCIQMLLPSHPYRPHGLGGPWPVPAMHGFAFLMKKWKHPDWFDQSNSNAHPWLWWMKMLAHLFQRILRMQCWFISSLDCWLISYN